MSREALSREISQVVSRVVSGEEIDAAARGAMLAAKYPELGMSGEMIGEAILRAANMVGMIKSAPMPAAWPDDPASPGEDGTPSGYHGDTQHENEASLDRSRSLEENLASAIGAELGERGEAGRSKPASAASEPRRGNPIAALRRAFFRQ